MIPIGCNFRLTMRATKMTPERFEKLDRLLEEVLSRSPGERTEFLDQACAGDPETRRKVESLISSYQRADSIFETPALELVRTTFENYFVESMSVTSFWP